MKPQKITVKANINATPKKVWNYWNEPEHITKWNFANDDWCCPKAENDLRAGGKLKTRMEAKDGSFGFDFEGVYDEIKEQETITYTIADGRKVTTTFEDLEGKTKVTTIFDAEQQNSIEMQKDGWQAILNNFKKYVESN
ncbi:MAG: SRPBCC family protein [Aquaticitalea sp.]